MGDLSKFVLIAGGWPSYLLGLQVTAGTWLSHDSKPVRR
jgi:hypothetical protein